jgi:peptide methionine sulfoxide reductase MsrA
MLLRRGGRQLIQRQPARAAVVLAASTSARSDDAAAAATAPRRAAAAAALAAALTITITTATPLAAFADPAPSPSSSAAPATTTVYFGNGCFWGRQKEFVDTELRALSRPPERVSAVAGYAGGRGGAEAASTDNKVCYHFNPPGQVYERLGHAEVVAVDLDPAKQEAEMRAFAKTYFSQFRKLRDGRLQRLDPQDAGPGYRNVVGLPGGGVRSPLFEVLKSEAPPGIELREGKGRAAEGGGGGAAQQEQEGDVVGVVWVVDGDALPFYRAEQYHQYHRGLEGKFPASYLKGQREVALKAGRIDPTGCLEFPF